jgi:DNA-binding LacI/PurR family transcriptional regulator
MAAAGIVPDPKLQVDAITLEQAGFDAAQTLIMQGDSFDAIFAASDLIAIGAIRALEAHGISVPSNVAIIGFDDIPAASLAHPPLTTVQQDYRLAGETLVDALLGQIRNEKVGAAMLPAKLVVRKSCGAA